NLVDIMNELDYMALHMVEVGILGIDGDLKGDNPKTTILEYAVYNEFGTKHIPPRPFMRNAIESNSQAISNYIEARVNDIFEGQITGRKALMQIGEYIRGLIIQSIATATNWAEPLSSKTLKAKLKEGSNNDKTLIEDRFLIKSIRYQITSKTGKIVYLSNFREV
uniref:hypothetical protein n=1 Tax=Fusobacterium sp. TaxID=68766 RepID=UPI0026261653